MPATTQKQKMLAHIGEHTLSRARDLAGVGVSATTISRAVSSGQILRIGRGLYQLPDAEISTYATLAEVSKRTPNAVICMMSALSFHGLTDQIPRKVWIAIGAKDWAPTMDYPKTRIVRFREPYFSNGREKHDIGGVPVQIYSVAKSIADAFRNKKMVDRSVAIESLKSALRSQKISPSELILAAQENGAWKQMKPYMEALTSNG
ncbi:MAG: AbiEi antitoxin N-terminal domain-containing protein [Rhodobacteraceae bacterium]|nr:AbiEi antitoxin N-terminal domain-containing protein [Paracoccaceae bacterium]